MILQLMLFIFQSSIMVLHLFLRPPLGPFLTAYSFARPNHGTRREQMYGIEIENQVFQLVHPRFIMIHHISSSMISDILQGRPLESESIMRPSTESSLSSPIYCAQLRNSEPKSAFPETRIQYKLHILTPMLRSFADLFSVTRVPLYLRFTLRGLQISQMKILTLKS
ncbi:hypothetical protein ABKN59_011108 [Abortiporus biennis]